MNSRQDYELNIIKDLPHGALAENFIRALLGTDRKQASDLVMQAVDSGKAVKELYLNVFQVSQREIGHLWQTGQISVAQEHFCTASTQVIMAQLYPHIFSNEKIGRKLVATCVGGELHEIGIRMVSDFFEMEGWDTYYLGANSPAESVISTIKDQQPDIVGISTTMYFNIPAVQELIDLIHREFEQANFKILVGGFPFLMAEDLWQQVGADGFAPSADEAISLANQMAKIN